MSLVIDVYNVLLTTGVLPPDLAGIGVLELHDLIATVSRYRNHHVMMVCDGVQPVLPQDPEDDDEVAMWRRSDGSGTWSRTEHGRVRILYSGAHNDADTLIGQIVHYSSAPRRLTVVTRDRAVQRHARKRGSKILGSDRFLEQLTEDWTQTSRRSTPPVLGYAVPLDDHAVRWWLRYFGLQPGEHGALRHIDAATIPPEMLDDREDDVVPPPPPGHAISTSRLLSAEDRRRLKAQLDQSTRDHAPRDDSTTPDDADAPATDDRIDIDDIDMGRIMGEG